MIFFMKKFIYVFKSEDRDKLLASGYKLLKEDANKSIFVFVNKSEQLHFSLNDVKCNFSNILRF